MIPNLRRIAGPPKALQSGLEWAEARFLVSVKGILFVARYMDYKPMWFDLRVADRPAR